MSKELTPLEALKELRSFCGDVYYSEIYDKDYKLIETALKRLEKFDKSSLTDEEKSILLKNIKDISTQDVKKLRAFEIIKEKRVNVAMILSCKSADDYNRWYDITWSNKHVTQEEYELLKEVLL